MGQWQVQLWKEAVGYPQNMILPWLKILSTWLKTLLIWVIFWWTYLHIYTHICKTRIYSFLLLTQRGLSTAFPQTSLSPIFQSCFFQVPDNSAKPLAIAHELTNNHMSGHFSLQAKWTTTCPTWSSAHRGDPLHDVLQRFPKRSYSIIAFHLWVVPAPCAESSINQAWVLFLQQLMTRTSASEALGAGWKREGGGGYENLDHFFV